MKLYQLPTDMSLRALAKQVGRTPHALAQANGIPSHTILKAGTSVMIPAPTCGSCTGRPSLLLACSAEARKTGTAPFYTRDDYSLLIYRGGVITSQEDIRLPRVRTACVSRVPTLLLPEGNPVCLPTSHALDTLLCSGYIGLALPHPLVADAYRELYDKLHEKDALLALSADGMRLLKTPVMLTSPCDILLITPPQDISLEVFLSDLTLLTAPRMRRKILLTLSPTDGVCDMQKGARKGRLSDKHCVRSVEDCYLGLSRLMYDGYGGICVPWGDTAPTLYHMACDAGQIIPASQRIGKHSLS